MWIRNFRFTKRKNKKALAFLLALFLGILPVFQLTTWADGIGFETVVSDTAESDAIESIDLENDALGSNALGSNALENNALESNALENDSLKSDALKNDAAENDSAENDTIDDALENNDGELSSMLSAPMSAPVTGTLSIENSANGTQLANTQNGAGLNGGTWDWNAATATLTLDNYDGGFIDINIQSADIGTITIILIGSSTIDSTLSNSNAIFINGNLIIGGTGSLEITAPDNIGINVEHQLMIENNATISAINAGGGISANNIIIDGSVGSIIGNGGSEDGIYAYNNITINGMIGSITGNGSGISAGDSIDIKGITGSITGDSNNGITAVGNVIISGTVNGDIRGKDTDSSGISAMGSVLITSTGKLNGSIMGGTGNNSRGIFSSAGSVIISGTVDGVISGRLGIYSTGPSGVTITGAIGSIRGNDRGILSSGGRIDMSGMTSPLTVSGGTYAFNSRPDLPADYTVEWSVNQDGLSPAIAPVNSYTWNIAHKFVQLTPPAAPLFPGDGTSLSPYQIATAEQLAQLAELVNEGDTFYNDKHYKLMGNIDLSTYGATWNGGAGWKPIGYHFDNGITQIYHHFKGHFDGDGKTITGLYINDQTLNNAGLFGYVNGGNIKDLGLQDLSITANNTNGGMASQVRNGSIKNCFVTGIISGRNSVGGIVGYVDHSSIENSYSTVAVSGLNSIGGLAAWVSSGGIVTNCYATGAVSSTTNAGGVVAEISGGTIINCAALNPSVTADSNVGRVVGRIINSPANSLDNNIAFSDMVAGNIAFDFASGPGGSYTDKDGVDIITSQIMTNSTLSNRFIAANGWSTQNGKLPGLFDNTVDMPAYLLATFNLETGTGTGSGWSWNGTVLTINDGANIEITGKVTGERRIVVAANATASIILDEVSITGLFSGNAPLQLQSGANVAITLSRSNILTGSSASAAIQAPIGTKLTIGGTGNLNATGGSYGAGIGGGYGSSSGDITISSGLVIASGGLSSAGIGGGFDASGGSVTITGGIVTASGGIYSAGIGGGENGSGGNITISGGMVTANGGMYGAGIGGGERGSGSYADGGNIKISGGMIIASGGDSGAGIGGGSQGSGGTITINGDAVVIAAGKIGVAGGVGWSANIGGAGIGGGYNGDGGSVTISGNAFVTANGCFSTLRSGSVAGLIDSNGIGRGGHYDDIGNNVGTFALEDNAIIFASNIGDLSDKDGGVLFNGNDGTVYGAVTLMSDLEIPAGYILTVKSGSSLDAQGVTLLNNGKIVNEGSVLGFAICGDCNIDPCECIFPPITYTVKFNSNGGSAVAEIPNIDYGSTIAAPANPIRAGWSFGGWYKDASLNKIWDFINDTITDDIALYAKWIDDIEPTAMVQYRTNGFKPFLNTITYGLFFRTAVDVTINGTDAGGSGVAEIAYYKARALETSFIGEIGIDFDPDYITNNLGGWTEISGNAVSFSVMAPEKFVLYVRVTDNAGNVKYYSDGIVIYENSTSITTEIKHPKLSGDKTAYFALSQGNHTTVNKIMNGTLTLIKNTNYKVVGTEIIFYADYLDNLAMGDYILTVHYNPMGEEFINMPGNDAPGTTSIDLTVSAAIHTHTWTDATCMVPKTCSGCSETEGAALGHDFLTVWTVRTPATCNNAGLEFMKCTRCDHEKTQQISAIGHSWGTWLITTPATTTAEGIETRTCSVCDDTQTRTLDKLPIDPTPSTSPSVSPSPSISPSVSPSPSTSPSVSPSPSTSPPASPTPSTAPPANPTPSAPPAVNPTPSTPPLASPTPSTKSPAPPVHTPANSNPSAPAPIDSNLPTPMPTDLDNDTNNVFDDFGTWNGRGTVTARIDADHDKFVSLYLDGEIIATENYTVTAGSTIIKLKEEYLQTLSPGRHLFNAEFSDGFVADIPLVINDVNPVELPPSDALQNIDKNLEIISDEAAITSPKIDEGRNKILWICFLSITAVGIIGLIIISRHGRLQKG